MLKRLTPFLPSLILLTIVIAIFSTLDILIHWNIKEVVDLLVGNSNNGIEPRTRVVTIFSLLAIFIPLFLLFTYLKSRFIRVSITKMKSNYIKKVFKKNINEFQKDNNSLYVSSLTNDYNQIELNYLEPMVDLIHSLLSFAAGVILFSLINPLILAIVVGLMIINLIISGISAKPLNKHNKERADLFASYTSYIKEVLSAFHIIKNNNLDNKVLDDYVKKSQNIQQKGYIIDKIKSIFFAIQNANFSLTFIGLIIVVGYMTIDGAITFGGLVLILNAADKVVGPIHNFSEALPKLFSVKSLFKRIDESLKNKNEYQETIDFNGFEKSLQLKDLSFEYDDGEGDTILEKVNLSFQKGGKYLIIGPSGGGKSTILKLLRKYFNPTEGDILIDDVPLKDIKKEQYFANIANIEQNVFIFEDTVRNNLTLYKDYGDDVVYEAIEKAGLTDFINNLPQGLETMIFDNGKNISGGERSRLAIARGLINKSDIIFLDEAFASLDMKKAKEIEKIILALDVTVINVSHVVFKEHQNLYDNVFVIKNKTASSLLT